MKTRKLLFMGGFLLIFGIDGFLLLDSSVPECKGFTGMGWFIFIDLRFEPMAILSNPECLTSFYLQTSFSILFAIGIWMILYSLIKKHNDKIHCES